MEEGCHFKSERCDSHSVQSQPEAKATPRKRKGAVKGQLSNYAHPICKKHRPSGLCFIAGNKTNSWKILFILVIPS